MHCCKHPNALALADDPRFGDDEFTQAALRERRARAAHAHGASLILALIGGVLLFGLFRRCSTR
jgi:hypothetical protein